MTNLMLLGIWLAMAFVAACVACRHIRRVYRTDWYDLSREGPLQELDWQQIREVVEIENDPLKNRPCWRRPRKMVLA